LASTWCWWLGSISPWLAIRAGLRGRVSRGTYCWLGPMRGVLWAWPGGELPGGRGLYKTEGNVCRFSVTKNDWFVQNRRKGLNIHIAQRRG
jgi:hypothetical protein